MIVKEEFLKRVKQIGYDEVKYIEIAKTLEEDVDENNSRLHSKYCEPSETNEEDN